MRYASLLGFYCLVVVASVAALAVNLVETDAAPTIETARPSTVGELAFSKPEDVPFIGDSDELSSPVLMVLPSGGDGVATETWLVFESAAVEAQAKKIEAGTKVRVRGRPGQGGPFRYLVVESIAKE